MDWIWDTFWGLFAPAANVLADTAKAVFDALLAVWQSYLHLIYGWIAWVFDPGRLLEVAVWVAVHLFDAFKSVLPDRLAGGLSDVLSAFQSVNWSSGLRSVAYLLGFVVDWNLLLICFGACVTVWIISVVLKCVIWILSMVWSSPS